MFSSPQNDNGIHIDAGIVNSFLTSTSSSFTEMVRTEYSYGQPSLVEDSATHRWEISGIIDVSGECEGKIALRLPSVLAEKSLERIGTPINNPAGRQNIMKKFVNSLVSRIIINAAADLSRYDINLVKPYTVYGKNHRIEWSGRSPIIGIPIRTAIGTLELEAGITCSKG